MWISKKKIEQLCANIRRVIDGQTIDLRDNQEGAWSALQNDIHTLAYHKVEQSHVLQQERDAMTEALVGVAHQIKTPLTSIMMMADLLADADPTKQAELLTNLKLGIKRMEWLAEALLKMAKLDAGAVSFKREAVSSTALIAQSLEPLQVLLDIKNQQIVSATPPTNMDSEEVVTAPEITITCDKRWTSEALTNLLKNASEATPSGGVIYVSVGENPMYQWIAVTDSGSGIDPTKRAKLFKRFEASSQDNGHGVGLPLALAIMRGQGGDIDVDFGGHGQGAGFMLKFYK